MKRIWAVALVLTVSFLYAEKLEVTAQRLDADEKRHLSTLSGNVVIKKGEDKIECEKLVIKFDMKNKPIFYTTKGGVKFEIHTKKEHFKGKAKELTYDPIKRLYTMRGSVYIKELKSDQELSGEVITIDRDNGKASISGTDTKPVKLIFDVQE